MDSFLSLDEFCLFLNLGKLEPYRTYYLVSGTFASIFLSVGFNRFQMLFSVVLYEHNKFTILLIGFWIIFSLAVAIIKKTIMNIPIHNSSPMNALAFISHGYITSVAIAI